MKRLSIYLFIISLSNLRGQEVLQNLMIFDQVSKTKAFNLEEIKVRWKKTALENCPGVSCLPTNTPGPSGPCASASCPTSSVTDVDGNIYNTVLIGTQCWLKENLRVTKYNNNSNIQSSTTPPLSSSTGERIIYQNRSIATVDTFGFLYNWYAATNILGICPTGWRVPSRSDFNLLIKFVDVGADTTSPSPSLTAGISLKSSGSSWGLSNISTNSSCFSALKSGAYLGYFTQDQAQYWSTSQQGSTAFSLGIFQDNSVETYNYDKKFGYSIRCIKD
jgi:uncharacterized protein (TIGR02145 family)